MATEDEMAKTVTSFEHSQRLRTAFEETKESPMFVKGTWDFPKPQLVLWYKDGDGAK